jgi:hypothetical protein
MVSTEVSSLAAHNTRLITLSKLDVHALQHALQQCRRRRLLILVLCVAFHIVAVITVIVVVTYAPAASQNTKSKPNASQSGVNRCSRSFADSSHTSVSPSASLPMPGRKTNFPATIIGSVPAGMVFGGARPAATMAATIFSSMIH